MKPLLLVLSLVTTIAAPVSAQEALAPTRSAGTPQILPRPDFHFDGNVGRTYLESDTPQFPQPVKAPAGAPNVVLVLIDDAGFGQFSTFGGGTPSPTMDKLAAEGLRFNRFHTTSLCSPTRAALLTGRNHHSVATGVIGEIATGYDGYTSIIPRSAGTVAEALRQNGYMTAWIGKNHNTPPWETSAAGPFDRWPNGLGFDYFYGFNTGDMSAKARTSRCWSMASRSPTVGWRGPSRPSSPSARDSMSAWISVRPWISLTSFHSSSPAPSRMCVSI